MLGLVLFVPMSLFILVKSHFVFYKNQFTEPGLVTYWEVDHPNSSGCNILNNGVRHLYTVKIYKNVKLYTPRRVYKIRKYMVPRYILDKEHPYVYPCEFRSYAISDYSGRLFLIDKQFELPSNFSPKRLVKVISIVKGEKREILLTAQVKEAFYTMKQAALKDGINLVLTSGYRSYSFQKWLFNYYASRHGLSRAITYSAYQGHSQHQTGWVVDVSVDSDSKTFDWLKRNAHKFGFVFPYFSYNKETVITNISGYVQEPWHLYYVGEPLASTIVKSKQEFLIWLESYLENNNDFLQLKLVSSF